jgi:hypothetical protein
MWMFSSLFGIWKLGLGFGAGSFGVFCLLFRSSRFVVCCDHEDLGFVESPSPSPPNDPMMLKIAKFGIFAR